MSKMECAFVNILTIVKYMRYGMLYNKFTLPLPVRILQLVSHEIKEVPSSEGKKAGVKGQRQTSYVIVSIRRLFEVLSVSCKYNRGQ